MLLSNLKLTVLLKISYTKKTPFLDVLISTTNMCFSLKSAYNSDTISFPGRLQYTDQRGSGCVFSWWGKLCIQNPIINVIYNRRNYYFPNNLLNQLFFCSTCSSSRSFLISSSFLSNLCCRSSARLFSCS